MRTHTPGPWHDNRIIPQGAGAIQITAPTPGGGYLFIADIQSIGAPGDAETIANARLIAAAPALLLACTRLLSALDEERAITGRRAMSQEMREAIAAIAQATGEETI